MELNSLELPNWGQHEHANPKTSPFKPLQRRFRNNLNDCRLLCGRNIHLQTIPAVGKLVMDPLIDGIGNALHRGIAHREEAAAGMLTPEVLLAPGGVGIVGIFVGTPIVVAGADVRHRSGGNLVIRATPTKNIPVVPLVNRAIIGRTGACALPIIAMRLQRLFAN